MFISLFRSMLLALVLGGCTLFSSAAMAGEAEKAEHTQLYEEMRKYAARNAWAGVEANYKRLLELEKKGEALTYEDHRLGAEAAREVGDMLACRLRLYLAWTLKGSDEATSFIVDLDANFGFVKIGFVEGLEGGSAVPAVPPFAPEQRAAINFANAKLTAGEPFTGLLPIGDYTIGPTTFTVVAHASTSIVVGSTPVSAPKEPRKKREKKPREPRPPRPPLMCLTCGE